MWLKSRSKLETKNNQQSAKKIGRTVAKVDNVTSSGGFLVEWCYKLLLRASVLKSVTFSVVSKIFRTNCANCSQFKNNIFQYHSSDRRCFTISERKKPRGSERPAATLRDSNRVTPISRYWLNELSIAHYVANDARKPFITFLYTAKHRTWVSRCARGAYSGQQKPEIPLVPCLWTPTVRA